MTRDLALSQIKRALTECFGSVEAENIISAISEANEVEALTRDFAVSYISKVTLGHDMASETEFGERIYNNAKAWAKGYLIAKKGK
jgi:hypothetical protein